MAVTPELSPSSQFLEEYLVEVEDLFNGGKYGKANTPSQSLQMDMFVPARSQDEVVCHTRKTLRSYNFLTRDERSSEGESL
ncbi:hypothetical protein LTR09_009606 [Extremus antarcticus]|uniref:Uncharacterized protein n=1 Tax=Extremus antarcticus TaxID=702011 RepID=A0AAJ0DFG4_9PEZI|nr:hypothetical protein LTR09_009606 [Extremus antarcticus]